MGTPKHGTSAHGIRAATPQVENYDFRTCKACSAPAGRFRFHLTRATVYVCDVCGFHYTDHLDSIDLRQVDRDEEALIREVQQNVETQLHSNSERLERHVNLTQKHLRLKGARVLDVGCGGGRFLARMREAGAHVVGIELDDRRAAYARRRYSLEIVNFPIEHDYWQATHRRGFDAVTMWDVIEHVNFPVHTLRAAACLLKPGGMLFLDTPIRDGFYHRFGAMSYRLTRGWSPTFLNVMYSNQRFGHKQIISTREMAQFIREAGLELMTLNRLHELSYPYQFYLQALLQSPRLALWLEPLAAGFFKLVRIRNKMLVVGRASPVDPWQARAAS